MTEPDKQHHPGDEAAAWDSAIRNRLASLASQPMDLSGLETRIGQQIPRPVVAKGFRKRFGCAPAVLLVIGLLLAVGAALYYRT